MTPIDNKLKVGEYFKNYRSSENRPLPKNRFLVDYLPLLSLNSTSLMPMWFSRKLITFKEMLSKMSRVDCLFIFKINQL